MVTWDDLAVELNKASDEFEKAIKAFNSAMASYQELIDCCEEITNKKSKS